MKSSNRILCSCEIYSLLSLQYPYLACLQIHETGECESRPVPCSLCGIEVALNLVSPNLTFCCLTTWLVLIHCVDINREQAM